MAEAILWVEGETVKTTDWGVEVDGKEYTPAQLAAFVRFIMKNHVPDLDAILKTDDA